MNQLLQQIPRISLLNLPTPLVELRSLSTCLSGPRILMKRDDLTGLALGGNKTRKLEFLLGEAISKGCDTVVTCGIAESNHCRQTSAASAAAGLKCHLVLQGDETCKPNANLYLDRLFGAVIHWCGQTPLDQKLKEVFDELTSAGYKTGLIPYGGSNVTGALGFVSAMAELKAQLELQELSPEYLLLPSSSGGTHAGLAAGVLLNQLPMQVIGIGIDRDSSGLPSYESELSHLANQIFKKLVSPCRLVDADFQMDYHYFGQGYGVIGDLEKEAIHLIAEREGILLDPVYNARTVGALISMIRQGRFKRTESVLIWNTGGAPLLFDRLADLF